MLITDILIRSLSGYIFVIPGILLYFLYLRQHRIMGQELSARDFAPAESLKRAVILCVFPTFQTAQMGQKIRRKPKLPLCGVALRKSRKKQTQLHMAGVFLFCYYLIGVLTMTGIGKLKEYAPRIVFIPFVDMVSGPVDTVLNVILFVPLGLFLPLLWKKLCRIRNAALTGFLFSLFIEILQMFGRGTTDVNDLITNTIGACLGYLIYTLLSKRIPKAVCRKFQSCETSDGLEVMFYIIYATAIMVTIQPFVIHSLFRLG